MSLITPNGDSALLITLGNDISEATLRRVVRCTMLIDQLIDAQKIEGVVECVPAYAAVMVTFDLLKTDFFTLKSELVSPIESELSQTDSAFLLSSSALMSTVEIPVCYDPSLGLDLSDLAKHCGLSISEVVQLHTAPTYLVYMLGFMPGFLYLGGLDPRLSMPRKKTPRGLINQGAVGIAGQQTGIYPLASPGGWQIIGQTPLSLFDAKRTPPTVAQPLQRVAFRAIDLDEYHHLKAVPR